MKRLGYAALVTTALLLCACASQQRAPIIDRSGAGSTSRPSTSATSSGSAAKPTTQPAQTTPAATPPPVVVARTAPTWDPNDPRPEFHSVQRGETLFGIALAYGLTYREVADWNALQPPYVIKVGQQLRLRPAQNTVTVIPAKPTSVDSTTIITDQTQDAGSLGNPEPMPAPLPKSAPASEPRAPQNDSLAPLKSEPKALKLQYTDSNWARYQGEPAAANASGATAKSVDAVAAPVVAAIPPASPPAVSPTPSRSDVQPGSASAFVEGISWGWPAPGKVSAPFSEDRKGVVLDGAVGQKVLATAAGQVSYVGNSLRGYGKMIVIKHNKMFLSVYAHNSKVLVKEGQSVGKGEPIAEMGGSDAERVMLHFEIRRYGKPVDPLKFLPNAAG